jgi:hypothetical protein
MFLFTVLFGIVEFGMAFNDYQSVRQGVREGARDAVVADYGSSTSCGLVGPAATSAVPHADNAREVICRTKERVGVGDDLRVRVVFDGDPDTGGYTDDKVKVCAQRQVASITGLMSPFLDQVVLRSEIEMRAEKDLSLPPGVTSEDPPPGKDWTWC